VTKRAQESDKEGACLDPLNEDERGISVGVFEPPPVNEFERGMVIVGVAEAAPVVHGRAHEQPH